MQKPAYSMTIVTVKPNETVPEALLVKLLSENRSAIGFAVRDGNSIEIEKFDEMDSVEDELKNYRSSLENTKKHYRMLCMSSLPAKFKAFEIQPWTILKDSKDKPLLVVACEGDFHKHAGTAGQSEFFTLIYDYLGPKIESLHMLLGYDLKKLTDYLKSKVFTEDLNQVCGHRGVFEFLPSEGEPFTYAANGKNEAGGEYTWGRASNIYGYTEAVQEAGTVEPPAEEKPKRSKYADDPSPSVPTVIPPKADPPTAPIEKVAAELPKKRRVDVPRNLHGKRKKAFIRDGLGHLPDDWDNMTFFEVDMATTVNSLADLSKTAVGVKDMKADAPMPVKSNVSEGMQVPVISGPQQAATVGFIKKFLDGNSNRIENPLELQKIESKIAVFSEVAGLNAGLDDLDSWSTTIMLQFIKEHPEAAWLAILEYRADRRKRKQLMLQGDKKLGDLTGTEVVEDPMKKSGTSPAPESPGPGPSLTPIEEPFKSRYA